MKKAKIFLVGGQNELVPMMEEDFSNEEALQLHLASHPDLLPGDQISPENPLRWLLVSRELGVPGGTEELGRWSLDHLFLDQDGIPTFVECKRSGDTRSRREVVAQMLDYAANGIEYWKIERLQEAARQTAEKRGRLLDDEIRQLISSDSQEDIENFWEEVETNLRRGKVRLIFVTEETPKELRKLVEFLNDKMQDVEVLIVEIKQYTGSGQKALVPRVLGITEAARSSKTGERKRHTTQAEFMQKCSPEAADFFSTVLERAKSQGHIIYWGTLGFSIRTSMDNGSVFSFVYGFPIDNFQFYFAQLPLGEEEKKALRKELLSFGIFRESGKATLASRLCEGDNLQKAYEVYEYIQRKMEDILRKAALPA